MKLIEVTVKNFRNIINSNPVRTQDDITCVVGKNESGKTSFLHALYRLNPVRPNVNFKVEDQYPAWLEKRDRMKGIELEKFKPIMVKFEINEELINETESIFGENIFKSNVLILERSYDGILHPSLELDSKLAIKAILKDLSFSRFVKSLPLLFCSSNIKADSFFPVNSIWFTLAF